jgi:hypothetical protein
MSFENAPLYRSHKQVRALEIASVTEGGPVGRNVFFADDAYPPALLPPEMFSRFVPTTGDFLVIYEDGYKSFSPRKAFLEGYSRVEGKRVSGAAVVAFFAALGLAAIVGSHIAHADEQKPPCQIGTMAPFPATPYGCQMIKLQAEAVRDVVKNSEGTLQIGDIMLYCERGLMANLPGRKEEAYLRMCDKLITEASK